MSRKRKHKAKGVVDAARPRRKRVHKGMSARKVASRPAAAPMSGTPNIVDDSWIPPVSMRGGTPTPVEKTVSAARRLANEGRRLYEMAKEQLKRARVRRRAPPKGTQAPRGRGN
ncbi:MAG: hypothetical protein HOW73_09310 [Polyangiaceae bacterium]|nr:hypothetical protein [Polyangiaceae bacterium]